MSVVVLDKLSKRFGGVQVVDNVDIHIPDGEFMVLLGPSGCGKSTTLRMIAGLESVSEGTIKIDGRIMTNVPAKDRDIAMVFQSYALYPHMSVAENLGFGLRRRKVAPAEIDRRVQEVADILGLAALLERKPGALSGGQRQRVALGRAMVREPKVFLFDEPLSNLDAALRVNTRNEIIKQHRRLGATMIYVTHDQVEAMTMGTRICVMNGGRVAQIGSPLDVYWEPADTFVARFLGSPPMNLFTAPLTKQGDGFIFNDQSFVVPLALWSSEKLAKYADRKVVFGVRAEDLHLDKPNSETQIGSISARAFAIEPLGAETLVVCETSLGEVTARLPRTVSVKPGERVELHFAASAAYLFDADSGKTLRSPVAPLRPQ